MDYVLISTKQVVMLVHLAVCLAGQSFALHPCLDPHPLLLRLPPYRKSGIALCPRSEDVMSWEEAALTTEDTAIKTSDQADWRLITTQRSVLDRLQVVMSQ